MKYTKEMNEYLSNLAIMNAKVHGVHWNGYGKDFVAMHLWTDDLYERLLDNYDEVAELMRMKGELPLISYKEYLKHATIEELETKEFSTKEIWKMLLEDLTTLKEQATKVRNLADEENDFTVVAKLEDEVASYEKDIWFVKETLRGF